ncbi:MAG: M20 family metallopeptidase [Bacteroidota bacterium]
MLELKRQIQSLAKQYLAETIEIRRHLHANPELSFQEYSTSDFIASQLKKYSIPFEQGMVKTGIVGLIEGRNPTKKTIALRADIDALPITESNTCEYSSKNVGVMHACGHDAHSASLLTSARILYELKNEFEGTIKLIFQPGEEKLPGGASLMIKEGVLENPRPQAILGQHVYPIMEAGKVGFKSGMYMASTDELYLTVKGKGGHAALPKDYINPLIIASDIIMELNKEFMLKEQKAPTVLAFGKIIGNGATNVIPDEVKLEGTFRTMDETWRLEAHTKMKNIATRVVSKYSGIADFRIVFGYPFLVNDEHKTMTARTAAEDYLGKENVEELPMRMTAEDFAFYSQQVPACFYRLGTGNKEKGITSGLHTSTFEIDERALETGSGLMAWLAINELSV